MTRPVVLVAASVLATLVVVTLVVAGYVYAGLADVAASSQGGFKDAILHTALHHAVEAESEGIAAPEDLDASERLRHGATHYDEMCATCHGAPGQEPGPHARGMHPAPPRFADHASHYDAAGTYWVIRHGIQMTGMPSWKDHADSDLWNLTALVLAMPKMSPDRYRALLDEARSEEQAHRERDGHSSESRHPH